MPPKSAAKKKASAPTAEVIVTLEGVAGSAETSTLPEDTPLKQVLLHWTKHRKLDPAPWRLVVRKELIGPHSEDIITDVLPHSYRRSTATSQVNATISFRGIELPVSIAPLRLAACDPAKRARPAAVDEVFTKLLEPTILPFALGRPLDTACAALVAKPWATGVRGWFQAGQWLKMWGLDKYFTPAQANAILPVIKAIKRPSPELNALVGEVNDAEITERMGGMETMETNEGLNLRFGMLNGLPVTLLWRRCSFAMESFCMANEMLAMGTMPATGGRLHYTELLSYVTGEMEDMARLNVRAFLPLRERVQELFPAVAQLSDMQVLLLLTYVTLPWPIDLNNTRVYGDSGYYGSVLHMIATEYKHSESTQGHPAWRPISSQPYQTMGGRYVVKGVPSGMTLDNTCRPPHKTKSVDGLPMSLTPTKEFRADLDTKLRLVTQFHLGQRR